MEAPWYKHAILYSLNVGTFLDSNGDGVGDFKGLTNSLDYLSELGITCIWMLPFYPSPLNDDGYDIKDYLNVDPRYGNLKDFDEFINRANILKIKIVVDLVLNHTSDQHPWFRESRKNKSSKYRNYCVWRENKPGDERCKASG